MDAVSNEKSEYFQFNDDNYADVFNAYWRKLYAIAYQRLKDSELAKDLVQEVFVYCWKQKDVIKVTTTVEAYLRSALKYQIIAHFRKLGIQDRAFSYLYERMVQVEEHMRDLLSEQDLARTLTSEMDKMPDTMREIYKMRIQNYSIDEIANELNIAKKTVRNNLSQGLHKLRNAIANDFPEDFLAICLVVHIILT